MNWARLLPCLSGLLSWSAVQAQNNWLTLVGDPNHPTADYIQFDPSALRRDRDVRVLPVRVSGAQPRISQDGTVFKSFAGTAVIDCRVQTAHFVNGAFYPEPEFRGAPARMKETGPPIDASTFRGLDGERTRQVLRAACASR